MGSRSMDSFNCPGDTANASRRSAPILLNQKAYIAGFRIDQPPDIADDSNETTATAKSKGGHTMAVSFWIADPPDMSFFSVICSKPPNPLSKGADFRVPPHVVGAEGRFVLLRAHFFSRYCKDELFMYTAGDTESPSLERVPLPDDDHDFTAAVDCLHRVREFGIVPRGLHYLVAALCDAHDTSLDYQLHIYSSESKTWSSRRLPRVKTIRPEKVITLGEGLLGWVDFSQGLLVCTLCQEPPSVCFIPLPKLFPVNRDKLRFPGDSPRLFRDLTCVDGKLKFIEMEHGVEVPEKPSYPCDNDVLYDSDLIRLLDSEDMDDKPNPRHGWRAVTWSRTVSSNCWRKEHVVDVADILVDESADSSLLSGSGETVRRFKFRDLYSVFPTLSIDNGDILYLKSAAEPSDRNGWVVAVDLGNKAVKALGAYPFQKAVPTNQAFRTSTLSCHLAITPGIKVSAYHKITQVGRSANYPNNASIRVFKPVSFGSRSELQRQLDEKLEKLKRTRDESQSSLQNDQSKMKHLRLQVEKITLSPNKAQRQNDHISQPPQQCFNKLDQPCYQRYSSWPQQNILIPQERFNMMNGLCGYAPLATIPVLHYGSYQPLWHQPPPWEQQQQFEPHKAAQPCSNKHNGGYHGYLQQLPAPPNSFAYGTHSVYGNNQQQWQSYPPNNNLPASGLWQQLPPVQHQLTSSGV